MPTYLRQSTAAQVRTIGPFVDDTDFKTLENALTINNTDILLKKNGGASAAKNSGGATADGSGGLYAVTWDATDTATVGELSYSVKVAGALVVFGSYFVVEEAVYDMLYAASAIGYVDGATVNVTKVAGTTQTAGDIIGDTNDIQARLPAALTADGNIKADTLRVGGTLQTAGDIIGDTNDIQARLPAALTADGNIKADTLRVGGTLQTAGDIIGDTNDIQTRLPAALVGGRIDANVGAMDAGVVTAAAVATGAVDADALATDAVNEIADGLLGRNVSGGSSAGRTVKQALHFLRNKWDVSAGTLTVYDTDDVTSSWTASVTSNAAADPITGNDPA